LPQLSLLALQQPSLPAWQQALLQVSLWPSEQVLQLLSSPVRLWQVRPWRVQRSQQPVLLLLQAPSVWQELSPLPVLQALLRALQSPRVWPLQLLEQPRVSVLPRLPALRQAALPLPVQAWQRLQALVPAR
jgi:hypothetical protein